MFLAGNGHEENGWPKPFAGVGGKFRTRMPSTNVAAEPEEDGPERLDSWVQSETRDWREVATTLLHAGRRVAADVEAGTIYDDVRIEHIFVGADGEVTLGGLTKAATQESSSAGPGEAIRTAAQSLQQRLSVAGSINMATYLAPERFRGGAATAASNQFSFAVVMYFCLYGKMPFESDPGQSSPAARHTPLGSVSFSLLLAALDRTTFVSLAREILAGNVRQPDHDAQVPEWVFPIIKRGLSPDSEDRYPSLTALLNDFEGHMTGRRVGGGSGRRLSGRQVYALAAGGLALLVGLVVLAAITR